MHKFLAPQKTITIGEITLGGQPGQYPTVLIGSLFYRGHQIVTDHQKGEFDRDRAAELLRTDQEWSIKTGLPRMIDVVGETVEALEKYVHFVAEQTGDPILVDSPVEKVRLEVMKSLRQSKIKNQLIYNSLDIGAGAQEINMLGELGVKNCVLMVFNSRSIKPFDRSKLLTKEQNILFRLAEAGVENILLDTGVLDLPSIGWSALAIADLKEKYGLVTGCAPSNALYMWKRTKQLEKEAFQAAGSVAMSLPVAYGADFIFYGPMVNASWVYAGVSMMDAVGAFTVKEYGVRPLTSQTPLLKIF
ncbi:tetrahydromethanopterin S-methyltransferase subunit H [Candidatus Formimonas warabiya]|uniref:Tetrahydromethanopterin S-methyltransferase subunit H n=1 Tax=Formimonas warabiya TaxID=1761012 RepID=A0A3G1KQV8_FORW1|nr:tetrahydromethanopterin S-methyltransferase subunit H [Candidatus Formimonas warabiya]ATW24862.1 hypothetical protein DCMF_08820 [Candidatus Formimonas warabiya]